MYLIWKNKYNIWIYISLNNINHKFSYLGIYDFFCIKKADTLLHLLKDLVIYKYMNHFIY